MQFVVFKLTNVLAGIFDETPPPVKYLTVNVVLEGEIPYVFVNKKLTGEYAVVNLSFSNGNPIPTLFGFGVISSVTVVGVPAPNCNWRLFKDVNLVAKRLATFLSLNKYGVSPF